jgi:phage tail-like protein
MPVELTAEADLRGGRINLAWTWTSPGLQQWPAELQLMRRTRAYPTGPEDGLCLLRLSNLLASDSDARHSERLLFLVHRAPPDEDEPDNHSSQQRHTGDGIIQAELLICCNSSSSKHPVRVVLSCFNDETGAMETVTIDDVSRVKRNQLHHSSWQSIEQIIIYTASGGGPEQFAARAFIFCGCRIQGEPDRLLWQWRGKPVQQLIFDWRELEVAAITVSSVQTTMTVDSADLQTGETGRELRSLTIRSELDPDVGEWCHRFGLADQDLLPETVFYYGLFVAGADGSDNNPVGRAAAMATGSYGLTEQLYPQLPAVLRKLDEPAPEQQGLGQLRAYVSLFGTALDQLRSLAEGLKNRHDVHQVDAAMLPSLARWIGWQPDQTLDVLSQRSNILVAPELYGSLGTVPNLKALVNRVTGWDCRIKELGNNVFLTNAPEPVHLWEIWRHTAPWIEPTPVTRSEGLDGRPAAVVDSDGVIWLLWHSERSGRRELWLQRLGVDPSPCRALPESQADRPGSSVYNDESPAVLVDGNRVRLFWSSNRDGPWEIWTCTLDRQDLTSSPPERLTRHTAADRSPAAVCDQQGRIWLFWESDRRGPTDIWARVHEEPDGWGPAFRVTTADTRHQTPAAAMRGSQLWLFWCADLGDRSEIFYQTYPTEAPDGKWSKPAVAVESQSQARNQAPSSFQWYGLIWLLWQTNCDGHWQIRIRGHDGSRWWYENTLTKHPAADKEPCAVVELDGRLHLFWRSQRRGLGYRSRTLDVDDAEMLANLGTFADRAHYTCDTGVANSDWYSRGTVALYLDPEGGSEEVARHLARLKAFIEPFRPLPVRYVWIDDSETYKETVSTIGLIREELVDELE